MTTNIVIILINYNGFLDTLACLESILEVDHELPFVVIVDNASTEKKDLRELYQLYSKLKIIKNEKNVGFGRANNIGVKWAQENIDFDFLLLLNNDTIIEPDSLLYLKEAFKIDHKIGLTTGKTMYEGNRSIIWYGGGEINYKRGWPKITDYNKEPTKEGANKARFVSFISGCVMMFTKKSIEEIRGFDEDFFMYCEDLELCMRTVKYGYKLYYEPQSVIYHKVQGSINKENKKVVGMKAGNKNLNFLFYHMKSNQWIAMRKTFKGRTFLKFSFYYWTEFIYLNLKFLVQRRLDFFLTSKKTLKRIVNY